jgi:hypothetical protein
VVTAIEGALSRYNMTGPSVWEGRAGLGFT